MFIEYSRKFVETRGNPIYDTVDPRNAGHVAKTGSSHAYTGELSSAVGDRHTNRQRVKGVVA